jgi:hypothetical protein
MVRRLDIGRYDAESSGSRDGCLSRGVICASLKFDGNLPCVKDLFASSVIICENSGLQDLIRDTGIMSKGDDFEGERL